jgi:hypothetical protein
MRWNRRLSGPDTSAMDLRLSISCARATERGGAAQQQRVPTSPTYIQLDAVPGRQHQPPSVPIIVWAPLVSAHPLPSAQLSNDRTSRLKGRLPPPLPLSLSFASLVPRMLLLLLHQWRQAIGRCIHQCLPGQKTASDARCRWWASGCCPKQARLSQFCRNFANLSRQPCHCHMEKRRFDPG